LCGISIFWRGNYRDKDMPRYDLTIAIFDTIRYIMPSLDERPCSVMLHSTPLWEQCLIMLKCMLLVRNMQYF